MTFVANRSLTDIRMTYGWHLTESDVRVALHEAGHAIVTLALGFRVELVTIEPGGGFSGRSIRSLECRAATDEDHLYIAVAGAAGESFGWVPSRDFFTDKRFESGLEQVEDAAPDATSTQIRSCIETAERMIRPYVGSLDALAAALLRKGTLDEAGIEKCLRPTANADLLLNHWKRFPRAATPPVIPAPSAPEPARGSFTREEAIRAIEAIIATPAWKRPASVRAMLDDLLDVQRGHQAPSYRIGTHRVETRDLIPGLRYGDTMSMEGRR